MPEKVSNVAMWGGSGAAVYFGFTPSEWQVIGILGGLVVGVAGLVINTWFKWRHLQLAVASAEEKK